MRRCLSFLLPSLFSAAFSFAGPPQVNLLSSNVVDANALTINGIYGSTINGAAFQLNAVTSFNGYQYVALYDADRHLALARRKLGDTTWEIARFTDYLFKGNDAHNTASVGICPKDGTIHLAFDHHISQLHYRVSRKNVATDPGNITWSAALFGPVTDTLDVPMKQLTYPGFIQTPEGNLQFLYRFGTSGAGERWMVDYDAATGKWHDNRQIDSGNGDFSDQFNTSHDRNAYPNGFDYGPDGRLHYTWVWRENTQGANHDLCYAYSDDHGTTWHNSAGALINTGDGKQIINVHTPGIIVVPLDRTRSLMNQQAQAVDHKGHIHVVIWHARDGINLNSTREPWIPEKSAYFHYWRDDAGNWHRNQLPGEIGNRPTLFFDKSDDAIAVYGINRDQSKWAHSLYFLNGQLCVATATAGAQWKDWAIAYRDPHSYMNEMQGDRQRLISDGILSIMTQQACVKPGTPAPLSILDFKIAGN